MKTLPLVLLLALAGLATECAAKPPYGKARLAAKSLGVPGGSCSGTAIGRYVILTATHCVRDGANAVTVDGKLCEVWQIVDDGADHAFLTLDESCPQKHVAKLAKWKAIAGEEVFVWGNPGVFKDMLRVGMVSGNATMPSIEAVLWPAMKHPAQLLTGSFGRGDSGAGVFNRRGELVGVVSFGTTTWTFPENMFCGMFPLLFTKEQWEQAQL